MKKILLIIALIFCIFQMVVLAIAIDIGAAAINRAETFPAGYTLIELSNPANENGTITSVEIWASSNLSNVEVATFYELETNMFSTRDTHTIGSVTSGSKQTFSGLSIDVEAGDYIGMYIPTGLIEEDTSGGVAMMYDGGDNIPCTNQGFSEASGYIISLYGAGETVSVGFDGPFNTKAITKWNTKEIAKWNIIP